MTSKYNDNDVVPHNQRVLDVKKELCRKLLRIEGYADMPLVSLEEAVEPLVNIVDDIKRKVSAAKWKCANSSTNKLSKDQSASIILYSMEWKPREKSLYHILNTSLRDEDRNKLKPWFLYLRLFMTALCRLPSYQDAVFRGIAKDVRNEHRQGTIIWWWNFSSCALRMDVLKNEQLFRSKGPRTFFAIDWINGKDICEHSPYRAEDEVLLLAARQFRISSLLPEESDLVIVQLQETEPAIPLIELIPITDTIQSSSTIVTQPAIPINIPHNAQWSLHGVTVTVDHKDDCKTNQLDSPCGLYVDKNQTVFIADSGNHRIVQWKSNTTRGQVVAGENGRGDRLDQLNDPVDVIVDKETNSLIISDCGNKRVMKWYLQSGTKKEKILIENIPCWGLIMNNQRYLYVSDYEKHEIRGYRIGEKNGTLIAGGYGQGNHLNQFNYPTYLFIDREYSVYVSHYFNHRVRKWVKRTKERIVVAGGQGQKNSLNRLSCPNGAFVDLLGTFYTTERNNHRMVRWHKRVTQGDVIIGRNGLGKGANQLYDPVDLSFDQHDHFYVSDYWKKTVLWQFVTFISSHVITV